jgi:DNA-directed RNA polymerase specialized sigma24 family protein
VSLETVTAASERLNAARAAERAAALELRDAIQSAREAGYSLAQIAQVLGISRQRVMQLSR